VDSADVISIKADNFETLTLTPPPVNSFQVELNWFRISFYEKGTEAFYNYLGKHIRYPYTARNTFTQGQLFLSFRIDDNGEMVNLKLINDIGKGCGKELLRVIKKVPGKFIPTKANETYILPVTFRISNHNPKVSDTVVQLPPGVKILSEVIVTATIQ
jgi:Gram-negative bacterial TonB protein C-terminal